jgi:hypothetical protein
VSTPTLIATAVVGKKKDDKERDKESSDMKLDSPRERDKVKAYHSTPLSSTPVSEKKVNFKLEMSTTETDLTSHEESDDVSPQFGFGFSHPFLCSLLVLPHAHSLYFYHFFASFYVRTNS